MTETLFDKKAEPERFKCNRCGEMRQYPYPKDTTICNLCGTNQSKPNPTGIEIYEPTQQEKIFNAIKLHGNRMNSVQIKRWGLENSIACADRRVRELVTAGKVQSRMMSNEEMEAFHTSKRLKVYEIPRS